MAKVHPHKGYLNTEFQIHSNGTENLSFEVHLIGSDDSTPLTLGVVIPYKPFSIRLKEPGRFRIDFSDGTSSEINVEDGYKFGGSKLKSAFIFDKCPWVFLIMQDRTYFFNRETEETYIEPISPDSIEEISTDYVIFSNNDLPERLIFSLQDQNPILVVSNIVFVNEEVVIWKDEDELVVYSLDKRVIIKRLNYILYYIDIENKQLLYAYDNIIKQITLYSDFNETDLYRWKGKFLAFINNSLSVSVSLNDNISRVQVINHVSKEIVKELEFKGHISSVNSRININISDRIRAIQKFNLDDAKFPEATINAIYCDITFYPCDWDIYYVVKTTSIIKAKDHFKLDEHITLHSINSDLKQKLNRYTNDVIITDKRFVLYNYFESFVRGKYHSAAGYSDTGKVFVHDNLVILYENKALYKLSNNGYWDNGVKCDYDFAKFKKYGIVFDKVTKEYRSLKHYKIKGKDISNSNSAIEYITLGDSIIFEGGRVISNKLDFPSFSKKPLATSQSNNLGISILNNKVFLMSLEGKEETCLEILKGKFDTSEYKQVLLSENGNQILYRNNLKTEVKDILNGEVFSFDNMSYIEQCNGIRPSFQSSSSLQPRIVNPINGQILDYKQLKKYKFISPDGKYYAGTIKDMYEEHYFRDTKEAIKNEEFNKLLISLSYPHEEKRNTLEWEEVTQRRIQFVKQHFQYINKNYPELTNLQLEEDKWNNGLIDCNNENSTLTFIRRVIAVRGIAIIRKMSDSTVVAKIDLGLPLSFINYVSFSYDAKYVSLAGYRSFDNGLFLIYDIEKQKMLWRENTDRAVWTTAFSCNGDIASYTSNPNTIYLNIEQDHSNDDKIKYNLIHKRNFLTFSPKGDLFALSNQGYTSKYDAFGKSREEWGHHPSTLVEVRCASNISDSIISFNDLSDSGIANTKRSTSVASVAFSNDNKRFMMVGNDGVVIIRNLHLEDYAK